MAKMVRRHEERRRYEIEVEGELAGFADFRERDGTLILPHTEILDGFEGRGLASELIAAVLADARERDLSVLPFCPFVRRYLERHPDQVDLVPETRRAEFGL